MDKIYLNMKNGTNVSREMILENSETLFHLGNIDKKL